MKLNWERDYPRFLTLFLGALLGVIMIYAVHGWYQQGFVWPNIERSDLRKTFIVALKLLAILLAIKELSRIVPKQLRERFLTWRKKSLVVSLSVEFAMFSVSLGVICLIVGFHPKPGTLITWLFFGLLYASSEFRSKAE
jgi:hypothetical protein